MKLASYDDGSRDGQLVVVSRDGGSAHYAGGLATRLQQALDDWGFVSPQLEDLSQALNHGQARHAFAFDAARCLAPLPRAFRWARPCGGDTAAPGDAAAARWVAGPLHHAAADALRGAHGDVPLPEGAPADGWTCTAGVAMLTGDIARGAAPGTALDGVRLLVAWCALAHADAALDAAAPAAAFAPLAVTPDELGAGWRHGVVALPLVCSVDGRRVAIDAPAPRGHGGEWLAALCRGGAVRAGSIVGLAPGGSFTVRLGDVLEIDLPGVDGFSVFGAIRQRVTGSGA